jgi:hypothetical protein
MVSPADLHGKRLAMVAWARTPDGRDDVVVFTGVAHWDGRHLTIFREPGPSSFPVADEWLGRIRPVEQDLKTALLGADYFFSVTVAALPEGEDLAGYLKTGLKWPMDEDAR